MTGHPWPPLRRDARCSLLVIRNRLTLEEQFVIQPANLRRAPSICSTARSSHVPRSNAIFAAILSARCAAPLTAGLRGNLESVGAFFSLAAFECLLAAALGLTFVATASMPALLRWRPCHRRVSYADVHVGVVGYRQHSHSIVSRDGRAFARFKRAHPLERSLGFRRE